MTEITAQTLNDLATKLEGLALAPEEQAVLHKVLERAGAFADETMGFVASEDELIGVKGFQPAEIPKVQAAGLQGIRTSLSPMALKLGSGAGLWD